MPHVKVKTTNNLKSLRPVLEQYIVLNKRMLRAWSWREVPWRFGERAQTGMFALAVFACGGLPFEEYRIEKRHILTSKDKYTGRNDLYFRFRSLNYYVEAKYAEKKLSRHNSSVIDRKLKLTHHDARQITRRNVRRLGLLFITPKLPRTSNQRGLSAKTTLQQYLGEWEGMIRSLYNKGKCSAYAWLFYERSLSKRSTRISHNYYPGIVLLVREV